MDIQYKTVILMFFFFYNIDFSFCCDGYKLKLVSIKNCGGAKQVIKVSENTTLKLNKDCEIIPNNTCVTSDGFKTAKVSYRISKNGIPVLTGNDDMCDKMATSNEEVKSLLEMFSLPTTCPVEKASLCTNPDNKVNMKKHKQFLGMAMGRISIHADIVHDTGKSCFDAEITVKK